jgi:DNA modification methylase
MTLALNTIHVGDCMDPADGIPALPDATVDALVTDPPAGIGFMGRAWDGDRGGRNAWVAWMTGVMRECLRVLRPGAHALVWALPRTSHWTATAVEDAGFEVRDVITHHFGTGFPKSLDVSKAIDKAAGAEREVVGPDPNWRRSAHTETVYSGGVNRPAHLTAPSTNAAKQWSGWGTALKPASEHWILARKPLIGTVAANVQAHGTGAINIDESRIEGGPRPLIDASASVISGDGRFGTMAGSRSAGATLLGRFPANVVFTHNHDCGTACTEGCPVAELDSQSGVLTSGAGQKSRRTSTAWEGGALRPLTTEFKASAGGASRFFYCAKPAASEKHTEREKNTHPTVKSVALMTYLVRLVTPPGGLVLDPFAGSGTTGVAALGGGWRFVGWEQDAAYHAIAAKRIREATVQGVFAFPAHATAAPPAPIPLSQPAPSVESSGSRATHATGDTARTTWGPAAQASALKHGESVCQIAQVHDLAASAGAVDVPEASGKRTADAAVVLDSVAAVVEEPASGPAPSHVEAVAAAEPSTTPRAAKAGSERSPSRPGPTLAPRRLDIRIVGEDGSETRMEVDRG